LQTQEPLTFTWKARVGIMSESGGEIARWDPRATEPINFGLTIEQYGKFEVPWNERITVRDWLAIYNDADTYEQKQMADSWLSSLTEHFDRTLAVISATSSLFVTNKELMDQYGGVNAFHERYPILRQGTDLRFKREKEAQSAFRAVKDVEPRALLNVFIPYSLPVTLAHQGISDMAYLLRRYRLEDIVPYLNTAMYSRLQSPRRKKDLYVNTSDWAEVKDVLHPQSFGARVGMFVKTAEGKKVVTKYMKANKIALTRTSSAEFSEGGPSTRTKNPASPWTGLWRYLIKRYHGEENKPRKRANVLEIPDKWLHDNSLQYDRATGLIVPLSPAFGTDPLPEERQRVIEEAVQDGVRSPFSGLGEGGGTVDFTLDEHVPRSQSASKVAAVEQRRRSSLSQSASPAPQQTGSPMQISGPASASGSPRLSMEAGEAQEVLRQAGNQAASTADLAIRQLRSNTLHRANAEAPPRQRESSIPAASRRTGLRPRQLERRDEDAEIDEEVDEEIAPAVRHTVATRANCKCTDKNSILAVMLQKMKSNSKLSDPARIKLINEYWRETRNGTKLGRICYNHVQFTAAKMGLKTRSLNLISLLDALQVLFRRKSHWGTIQGDPVTSILFTSAFRGVRQHQDLRSYRYRPANVRTQIDWKAVRKAMGLDKVYDLFKETGTVCLPLFDFAVEDEELMKIVNESFKMYQYHTRCIDGASNLGWNRVIFYSGV
jgi:hypothetical protein